MTSKRISLNGVIGIFLMLVGVGVYIGTYYMRLRPNEVIQPRVSVALMAIGGLWIFVTEFRTPSKEYIKLDKDITLFATLVGVSAAMYLYGQAVLRLGVGVSTFVFLSLWWLYSSYRDAKKGSIPAFWPAFAKMLVLAAAVSGSLYLLFMVFLQMYLPGALLF